LAQVHLDNALFRHKNDLTGIIVIGEVRLRNGYTSQVSQTGREYISERGCARAEGRPTISHGEAA